MLKRKGELRRGTNDLPYPISMIVFYCPFLIVFTCLPHFIFILNSIKMGRRSIKELSCTSVHKVDIYFIRKRISRYIYKRKENHNEMDKTKEKLGFRSTTLQNMG